MMGLQVKKIIDFSNNVNKKLLGILVLGLFLISSNAFAKDLSGKIIFCEHWRNSATQYADEPEHWQYTSFKFISENKVEVIRIYNFELSKTTYDYKVGKRNIKVGSGYTWWINREELTLNNDKYCIVSEDINNLEELMEKNLKKTIDTQEKLNKI